MTHASELSFQRADAALRRLSRLAAAIAYINRQRERGGVQKPLRLGPASWTSHTAPTEGWTDEDIVSEARALGWDG